MLSKVKMVKVREELQEQNPSEANSELIVKPIDFKIEGDPIADSIRKQSEVEAGCSK